MAGTKEGAEKRKRTMIAKFGSKEKYLEFMRSVGAQGGKIGGGGGFSDMDTETVKKHSRKGIEARWGKKYRDKQSEA